MKLAILICALVVLACHETLGYGEGIPLLEDNCQSKDVPHHLTGRCMKIACITDKNGKSDYALTGCQPYYCTSSEPADPTKKYPECCPRNLCT